MQWAQQFVPTEWLALVDRPIEVHVGNRGWYDPDTGRASIADLGGDVDGVPAYGKSALHELLHHLAEQVPDLWAAQWTYHWQRTSAGSPGARSRRGDNARRSLADMRPGHDHTRDEVTRPDGYPDPYMGREYRDERSWELASMAWESLFAGSRYLDDDLRHWVLGLLAWRAQAGAGEEG